MVTVGGGDELRPPDGGVEWWWMIEFLLPRDVVVVIWIRFGNHGTDSGHLGTRSTKVKPGQIFKPWSNQKTEVGEILVARKRVERTIWLSYSVNVAVIGVNGFVYPNRPERVSSIDENRTLLERSVTHKEMLPRRGICKSLRPQGRVSVHICI